MLKKGPLQANVIEANIPNPEQPVFRPGHGTVTTLLTVMNDPLLNGGHTSFLKHVDLTTAFEVDSHERVLLSKSQTKLKCIHTLWY